MPHHGMLAPKKTIDRSEQERTAWNSAWCLATIAARSGVLVFPVYRLATSVYGTASLFTARVREFGVYLGRLCTCAQHTSARPSMEETAGLPYHIPGLWQTHA